VGSYVNSQGVSLVYSPTGTTSYWLQYQSAGTYTGTSGSDNFYASSNQTLVGGNGNDVYTLYGTTNTKIVENAGGGNDTVVAYDKFQLPDNVENLVLGGDNAWAGIGNAQDNIIIASASMSASARTQIDGGAGNDVLVGGGGHDTFVAQAGNGSDVIYNFDINADKITLQNYGVTNFSQVQSIAKQVGADTVLSFANGETLTLRGTAASSLTASDFTSFLDTSKMKMSFDDEFNSLSLNTGTAATKGGEWKTSYHYAASTSLSSRFMNGEKQIYTDPDFKGTSSAPLGVNPFSINNGVLSITAAPASAAIKPSIGNQTYTSGVLTTETSFSQEYGYFEVRAQMPTNNGFWPAFWLLPTDKSWPPEIDVFEQLSRDPNTLYMTSHDTTSTSQGKYFLDTTQMHTYGINWTKDYLTWYIDGVQVYQIPTPASMHKEMYMLLDLAVGDWGGPTDATTGTGSFKIDYVHVYQNSDTVSTTINGVHTAITPTTGTDTGTPTTPPTGTPTAPPTGTGASNSGTSTSTSTGSTGSTGSSSTTTSVITPPVLTGTSGADKLISKGVAGTVLNGGAGDDYLEAHGINNQLNGGAGNDTYMINDASQVVTELAGGGWDYVQASVSYTLTDNVEGLNLLGSANINGTGNALDNSIDGNSGNNVLLGMAGNDILDGKAGADHMEGGAGNDTYYVDNPGDVVVELAGGGWDYVQASISYTLPDNVEGLNLLGSANINGTGNALDNAINGNSGNNILLGMAGNDTLDGKGGADHMEGGTGNDTYYVDNPGDVMIELPGGGWDSVKSTISYTLGANVEALYLQGSANINGTGNELDNTISGNAGNNVITGGKGNDILSGGGGKDTFVFAAGDGKDQITDFISSNDTLKFVGVDPASVKLAQSGKDVVVSYGHGDTIVLVGVSATDPLLKAHMVFG
jgi:serralysin